MKKFEKMTTREMIKKLSPPTRLYLVFKVLAVFIAMIVCAPLITHEANALDAQTKTILIFAVIYTVFATIIITLSSMYNQERNVIAVLAPLIMTIISLILSFWLYDEYLDDRINLASIIITLLTVVLIPLVSFSFSRALSIKPAKLYWLSFFQIVIVGVLAWLEFTYLV